MHDLEEDIVRCRYISAKNNITKDTITKT